MAPSPLLESISARFEEVQNSVANHRKNCVALYKIHVQAAKKKTGEEAFGDVFVGMIARILDVNKKCLTAERAVRFVGSYVKYVNDKVLEEKEKKASTSQSTEAEEEDTVASRFVARLLEWLFRGFQAKNKMVRLRTVHIVSEMIAHIGEIDGDTYDLLRDNLLDRIYDKETPVRVHAVIGLSKLIGTEDPSEVEAGEKTILEMLLEIACHDPAPEVRRAALLNLPLTPDTLDIILMRTRDTDTLTRKLVYSSVLLTQLDHPRRLTIAQREDIVKTGLGDREPAVRAAVGKLMNAWFDVVNVAAPEGEEETTWEGDDGGIMKAFTRFLALFDVVGPGEAIAVDALLSVLTTRPTLANVFVFPENYWEYLTPESAVLARVFMEHCLSTENEKGLEGASLPVVTAFAFHIQESYNALLRLMQEAELLGGGAEIDDPEVEEREEELAKKEVVLGELVKMADKLDYMDEIGRRKVFSVIKEMLAHPQLPPSLIDPCLDVLKEILPSERELIRVVVETVIDLRDDDTEGGDALDDNTSQLDGETTQSTIPKERSLRRAKEAQEMSAEERREADLTDIRCLTLCIAMLERVHGSFEDNSTLEGMLADLIIPAVKRKELALREKGLICLGLCCLIAKNMALSSFQLFLSQVANAPEDLKLKVLQIILDLLIMYDYDFLRRSEDIAEQIVTFLLQTLETEESNQIQAVLCLGICKLLLAGVIADPRVLTNLALTYISPATSDNAELRQCLSYFFPVYCYSSSANQSRMRSIFISAYDLVCQMHEQLEEDQEMITPQQFGLLMVDWTDPQKAAYKNPPPNVHVELAIDILLALYDSERTDDDSKALCSLLGQLQFGSELEPKLVYKAKILFDNLQKQCPLNNAASEKILARMKGRFEKMFKKQIEEIDPEEFAEDDELREMCDSIGVEAPGEAPGKKRGARARKASSADEDEPAEDGNADEDQEGQAEEEQEQEQEPPEEQQAEEEEIEEEDIEPPKTDPPVKKPKRRSKTQPSPDEDEHETVNEQEPEPPKKSKRRSKRTSAPDDLEEPPKETVEPKRRPAAPVKKPKGRSKRNSVPDEKEEEEEEHQKARPSTPVRRSKRRSKEQPAEEVDEEPEQPDPPRPSTPVRKGKGRSRTRASRADESDEEHHQASVITPMKPSTKRTIAQVPGAEHSPARKKRQQQPKKTRTSAAVAKKTEPRRSTRVPSARKRNRLSNSDGTEGGLSSDEI